MTSPSLSAETVVKTTTSKNLSPKVNSKPAVPLVGGKKKRQSMLKRTLSFTLRKAVSKRALTPMRKRISETDTASLSSNEDLDRAVRFEFEKGGRSKKVKAKVVTFDKVSVEDAPRVWYHENEMMETVEDVKHVVRHYIKKCDRYRSAMEKITDTCATVTSEETESVTSQFDARIIEQLANADARGLEHHISPRINEIRKEIVRSVVDAQDALYYVSPEEREQLLADKYKELSRASRLLAKTMGDGDALVAATAAKA